MAAGLQFPVRRAGLRGEAEKPVVRWTTPAERAATDEHRALRVAGLRSAKTTRQIVRIGSQQGGGEKSGLGGQRGADHVRGLLRQEIGVDGRRVQRVFGCVGEVVELEEPLCELRRHLAP
jgi:hypothetical protein